MNKSILLFFLIIFIAFPQLASANLFENPAKIEEFINLLPDMKTISCKFEQTKYLSNIEKPIISSGNFKFVEKEGVYFETLKPIKTTISYTNKDYKQINDIILAISQKKYSKLNKDFYYFFDKNETSWQLGLKPKPESPASNYIVSISIEGKNHIEKMKLQFKNGSSTIICFSGFQAQ